MITENEKQEIPTFEANDLFKAMRILVNAFGTKNLEKRTASLAISAQSIKQMADESEMKIFYEADGDSFVFEIPIKLNRSRKIIKPRLILPNKN